MLFKASAPGSLMLLGEYAVLYGKYALVCAVDRRITVTLTPRSDQEIEINSSLGNLTTDLSKLTITPPFQFVTATLKKFRQQMPSGCHILIEADFSDQVGLGSSAAVTTALLATLTNWFGQPLTAPDMVRQVRAIIRQVQGVGSGADAAASVLGGMVAYKAAPFYTEKLTGNCSLTAAYAGYKTPTVQAIKRVTDLFATQPRVFQKICQAIDECAVQGIAAVRKMDWQALGKIMNMQQGLLDALDINTPELLESIVQLRAQTSIFGAKISGSGLGDCVVGLGVAAGVTFKDEKIKLIPLPMATQGVISEKI
ncbi:MAG: mevalonate kinase [Pseudomonadota bacterium]